MAELVDALDLGSSGATRPSSSLGLPRPSPPRSGHPDLLVGVPSSDRESA
jgi:hypothetical protein